MMQANHASQPNPMSTLHPSTPQATPQATQPMPHQEADCPLCQALPGVGVYGCDAFRVIRVVAVPGDMEQGYPAFYRLVWRAHVRELSDLSAAQLQLCMQALVTLERCLREQLSPAPSKINLASLGNMVPHLHWHIIARYEWDAHWPKPVWAAAQRSSHAGTLAALAAQLPRLDEHIAQALSKLSVISDLTAAK
jgi:diadenosine tetraphosphate (Ap4A) HIT family hydrolase